MTLEGGVAATATGGRIGFYSHPKGGPHRVTLVGTRATETFDVWTPRAEVYNGEPAPVLPTPHPEDPMSMWASTQAASGVPRKPGWVALADDTNWYPQDVRRVVDCLESGHRPDVAAVDAALSLEVLMAVYRSAARGEEVEVERV